MRRFLLPLSFLLFAPSASAAEPPVHAYGILVGSNAGGAGQQTLRYAEDDAKRVADVLRDLGRFGPSDLRVLAHPDAHAVMAAVDDVAAKVKADRERGDQSVVLFYYSGHARTAAFDLGSEQLPVSTLRDKLRALPTTLTLVVLDACQSGQFARVKGAEPAADFSFNSVSHLTTKGVAVMASSTAQELSQESDELKSSYFTHHLVVGLRGAADADGDGRVSLDEAYRYAYRRTLVSTAQTQVGSQHVTLDTDLAGQGELPVTYPAAARAQIELPASLNARVLVQHKASGSIVAEVQKAPGAPVRLALAAGAYEAIVRPEHGVLRCRVALADGRITALDVSPTSCDPVVESATTAKGDVEVGYADAARDAPATMPAEVEARYLDPWRIELGIGFMFRTQDAYTRRLNEFGYKYDAGMFEILKKPHYRVSAGVYKGIIPHLSLGLELHTLEGDEYKRTDIGSRHDSFAWDAYGATWWARLSTDPLLRRSARSGYLMFYGQVGGGLVLGTTTLVTESSTAGASNTTATDTQFGWEAGAMAGVAMNASKIGGAFLQGGYEYAPAIKNLVGDTHNSGGFSVQVGGSVRF